MASVTRDIPAAIPGRAIGRGRFGGAGFWITLALLIGLLIMVIPFVWMLLGSFKTTAELR